MERSGPELLERLRALYTPDAWTPAAVEALRAVYAPEVTFRDPLQTVHGVEAFLAVMGRLVARTRSLAFVFSEGYVAGDVCFLTWECVLRPRWPGPRITIEGCSQLAARGGLVVYHRDYWDLLGSAMQSTAPTAALHRSLARVLA